MKDLSQVKRIIILSMANIVLLAIKFVIGVLGGHARRADFGIIGKAHVEVMVRERCVMLQRGNLWEHIIKSGPNSVHIIGYGGQTKVILVHIFHILEKPGHFSETVISLRRI